jgi:hypothetical protein
VDEPIFEAADSTARELLANQGWEIEEPDEHLLVTDETCPPGAAGREYFEQARIDGLVLVLHTWPVGGPDEE